MRDRFLKLSNGTLINLFAVTKAIPSTNAQGAMVLTLRLHSAEEQYTGDDATAIYQALQEEFTSPEPAKSAAPFQPPAPAPVPIPTFSQPEPPAAPTAPPQTT